MSKYNFKECPFCGGTAQHYSVVAFNNGEPEQKWGVECLMCGARTPANDYTKSGALAFWNVRRDKNFYDV